MIEQAKNPIEVRHSICLQFQRTLYGMTSLKRKCFFFVREKVFLCDIENIFVTEEAKIPKVLDFFEIFFFLSQTIKINERIFLR